MLCDTIIGMSKNAFEVDSKLTVLKDPSLSKRSPCNGVAALGNASWPTAYIGF